MSELEDLIRKRQSHLTKCTQYLQAELLNHCPSPIYQLVKDRINLIDEHKRKIDDISGFIKRLQSKNSSDSVSDLQQSFYNQIFSRLQEIEAIIGVLDDVWSSHIAFDNFSRKFNDLYLIFSKLCDEISLPLGSHVSMILPGDSFAYLNFQDISRSLFRIFAPISALENPNVWPIMAHEIGHAFYFLPTVEGQMQAECGPVISQYLSSIQQRVRRSREEFADIEYVLSRSWYQWVAETFADLFALRRIGPCFIDAEMFELMVFDPFSLSIESSGRLICSSHPPPDLRVKSLINCANRWFPDNSARISLSQKSWDDLLSSRASSTLEENREFFDLLCDPKVQQAIEERVVAKLDQFVPLQNFTGSSLETLMNTEPISVSDILSSFLSEAKTNDNFVEKLASKIRQAI